MQLEQRLLTIKPKHGIMSLPVTIVSIRRTYTSGGEGVVSIIRDNGTGGSHASPKVCSRNVLRINNAAIYWDRSARFCSSISDHISGRLRHILQSLASSGRSCRLADRVDRRPSANLFELSWLFDKWQYVDRLEPHSFGSFHRLLR